MSKEMYCVYLAGSNFLIKKSTEDSDCLYKIGYSGDVDHRMKRMSSGYAGISDWFSVIIFECGDKFSAKEFERFLKSRFRNDNIATPELRPHTGRYKPGISKELYRFQRMRKKDVLSKIREIASKVPNVHERILAKHGAS